MHVRRLIDLAPRVRLLLAAALIAAVIAGCSVSLRTAPAPADMCDIALTSGTLVQDPRSGLGLENPAGEVTPVVWPFGYSTRMDMGGIALVDATGKVIAHEGDALEVGGDGGDGVWVACGFGITNVTR